jgi:hypothetical protein
MTRARRFTIADNRAAKLQRCRVAIARVGGRHVGWRQAEEFFFETDPTPTPYTAPQEKAGPVIKGGEKNFLLKSLGVAVLKAISEVLRR